jgi:phosphopantothenoylcysteine decarboxylase / phosphopantothenate---cysteine ligase
LQNEPESEIKCEMGRFAGKTVLLGVSGSIAAYKAAQIASHLAQDGVDVHVLMTQHATNLVGPATFRALTGNPVLIDAFDEPKVGEIAHVDIAQRADVFLIAPATANIIGKIAHGIADDFLTTAALVARCPKIVAPAMNSRMWSNPFVIGNVDRLRSFGYTIVEPGSGYLACGEEGVGRLADVEEILGITIAALSGKEADLVGMRIMVTAGPTRERIDPVRFISNYSSGKMGYAIADAAVARGASVTLISGHTSLDVPADVKCVNVESAQEMYDAVLEHFPEVDVVISPAAVADFVPKLRVGQKIKKTGEAFALDLEPAPDILARLGEVKGRKILVGFAAETENIEENARKKLAGKNLDMIIANDVSDPAAVFGSDTNTVTLIPIEGELRRWPKMSKREVADRILDYIKQNLWEDRN